MMSGLLRCESCEADRAYAVVVAEKAKCLSSDAAATGFARNKGLEVWDDESQK